MISPVGVLTLVAGDDGLRAVIWPDESIDRQQTLRGSNLAESRLGEFDIVHDSVALGPL